MASSDSARGAEEELKKSWEKCGRVYVNQAVFNSCFSMIEDWISIPGLVGHMMAYGLITKTKHITAITNPHLTPDQRMQLLLEHIGKCGRHAYFWLYVCLYESQDDNRGHVEACEVLREKATEIGLKAPWEQAQVPSSPVQVSEGEPNLLHQGESVERDQGSSSTATGYSVEEETGNVRSSMVPTQVNSLHPRDPQLAEDDGRSRRTNDSLMPYKLSKSKPRGLALIINNYKFSPSTELSERICGPTDGETLKTCFKSCGYRIRLEANKTASDIHSIFSSLLPLKTSPTDSISPDMVHEEDDSFVCCVVSHGCWDQGKKQDFVYGTDGELISIQQLALDYLHVTDESDHRDLLKTKPKLFFVHACRGKELTPVTADSDKSKKQRLPSLPQVNLFPISADFLFSYPVVPGTKAFRDDHSGTFFIIILSQMIRDLWKKLDVVPIVKRVHYELTSNPDTMYSYEDEEGRVVRVRHCPQLISTLRGPFFLTKEAEDRYKKHIK